MNKWSYVEPGDDGITPVKRTLSEDRIIEQYYPYWSAQMRKAGKDESLINVQNCIEDWVVINWAEKDNDAN